MPKRLISYDPVNGIKTFHDFDTVTKQTEITYEYDSVASVLDMNKRERNDFDRTKQDEAWWKVATIPIAICNKWMIEDGINVWNKNHADRVFKKLNDPDWAYLRTSPGGV